MYRCRFGLIPGRKGIDCATNPKNMSANTYLNIALAVAAIAVALKVIGPLASRWHKKLERDLQRMKQGGNSHR